MRRLCSSRASLTSICCRNARSTATQIVFEKGYATIGPSTTIGTQIASVSGDRDVGDRQHEDRDEHDREQPADEDQVDRQRTGEVAVLALEVESAARAVVDHLEPVAEQLARTASGAPTGHPSPQHRAAARLVGHAASLSDHCVRRSVVGDAHGAALPWRLGERARAGRRRGPRRSRADRREAPRSRCRCVGAPSRSNATDVASTTTSPSTSPADARAGCASTRAWVLAGSTRRNPERGGRADHTRPRAS